MATVGTRFHTYSFNNDIEGWSVKIDFPLDGADIPKRDGVLINSGKVGQRVYQLKGQIQASTPTALRTARDAMLQVIANRTGNLYLFTDRFAEARLTKYSEAIVDGSGIEALDFILEFTCSEPFEQSETLNSSSLTTSTSGDSTYTVTNNGNYETFAKITVTAPASSIVNDILVSNTTRDETFTFLGTLAGTKALIVNSLVTPFTVTNDGVDAVSDFSGEVIKLSPGANTIKFNAIINAVLKFEWRDRWV